jgi:alpha-mannosidase
MNPRHLILLSPYRLPTESTLYLGDEEVAAFLNGYSVLWHPAALAGAEGLPRIATPYDHEQPAAGFVYVVPENPPLMLPDDWEEKARQAGAVVVRATADREQTLAQLLETLQTSLPEDDSGRALLDLPRERVGPFFGLALGSVVLEALFEAMSHENVLASEDLWKDVSAAVAALKDPDPEAVRVHLQAAADRQLAAREVVYPVTVYVVDMMLLGPLGSGPSSRSAGVPAVNEGTGGTPPVGQQDTGGTPELWEQQTGTQSVASHWPAAFAMGEPMNVITCAELLERMGKEKPERLAELRERVGADLVEVLGGPYREREDPFLPLESQVWNLLHGQSVYQELLGQEVRVFARKRFGFHHQLPLLLQSVGISHALLVPFDESVVPTHRSPVVSWPSHDGKQVDCFTRVPQPADTPQTFFHLAHYLHQTIMQDQSATLALLHRDRPASPFYRDLLELSRFAPVLGRWTTLSGYFNEVLTGDYTSPVSPDEFHGDYLLERTTATGEGEQLRRPTPFPINDFAAQVRGRRKLDAAWTFTALLRALGGQIEPVEGTPFVQYLSGLEDRFESLSQYTGQTMTEQVQLAMDQAAGALARRLVARGQPNSPGYLILNPCSFIRRVTLELPGYTTPVPVGGPIKACQLDGDTVRLVVHLEALGFAWVPASLPGANAPGSPPQTRMRLADERCVRNEFFEAEIDAQTGGLRAVRDIRTRISRLGAMLVYNPGSSMRATSIQVTSAGPALGEIVSEGTLHDEQGELLATFRQRFRAWLGRPLLEMRIELNPVKPPEGYPWHAFYAARFAWRDESAALLRGAFGSATLTSHTRPETPDFLEVRTGRQNTVIFPGGLPFHQRNGGRMLDVLLIAGGETMNTFDIGISLDREQPSQTALGIASPIGLVRCEQGPPHVGASGWLFHLDASNLMLSSLRPAPDGVDGVIATLLETTSQSVQANLRCVRIPVRAFVQDLRGNALLDGMTQDDTVLLDVSPSDLFQLRVEFS